jgi:hypothetical protein
MKAKRGDSELSIRIIGCRFPVTGSQAGKVCFHGKCLYINCIRATPRLCQLLFRRSSNLFMKENSLKPEARRKHY